ncbi:hemolysin III family protein [Rheinheimera sediminis]|uniref:PAQR family membrane homeostasis protein TrhA n=1 Tax=Rheinheimera sp. YQF-1 TaxID=2499626 RepID=UPI000FD6DD02|nr:hemolysin III family protein [Rheinheimera sp. YQF-1]RVT49080.1 hemolysin III family protein [Rheinheimera sp. YQF-1]
MKAVTSYSATEEVSHAISHGVGVFASLIGLYLMLELSAEADIWRQISSWVFGLSLILLYGSSTLYHAIHNQQHKLWLRKLDHSAIFVLIAGTYTPFTLISLRENWGWWLFAFVWTVALIGVLLKLLTGAKYQKLSLAMYLLMGWTVIVAINPMLTYVPAAGLWWLLAGGVLYSGGVAFYVQKTLFMHHLIWHLFVLSGSVCHFLAVYWYVLPQTVVG